MLYKNLVQIIRKYDKNVKVVLIKVNHAYFSKLDFEPYRKYFDQTIEFDFIHYKKNLFRGWQEIFNFQKRIKDINTAFMSGFERIDLFLDDSAYLPVNILLYNLSRQKNVKNIVKFSFGGLEGLQTKTDKIRTFLCALYSLPFKSYKIRVLNNLEGQFINFSYSEDTPGIIVKIISPTADLLSGFGYPKENVLPYPIAFKYSPSAKKDMVIVFGKGKSFQNNPKYFSDYETYIKKLTAFFKVLENKYSDCRLCYKSFPLDEGQIMPGIDIKKYSLLDDTADAQELLDKYQQRIKAVYSPLSAIAVHSSFFGIPSYTFFRYLCSQAGIEKFNSLMNKDILRSEFLFHISNLSEIGKIDDLSRPIVDSKKLEKIYRKILYV